MNSRPCPQQERARNDKTANRRMVIIETISVQQGEDKMNSKTNDRRGFLHGMLAAGSVAAAAPLAARPQPACCVAGDMPFLPAYTRAQNYQSLKQSSYDRTGGNSDRWPVAAGGVQEGRS